MLGNGAERASKKQFEIMKNRLSKDILDVLKSNKDRESKNDEIRKLCVRGWNEFFENQGLHFLKMEIDKNSSITLIPKKELGEFKERIDKMYDGIRINYRVNQGYQYFSYYPVYADKFKYLFQSLSELDLQVKRMEILKEQELKDLEDNKTKMLEKSEREAAKLIVNKMEVAVAAALAVAVACLVIIHITVPGAILVTLGLEAGLTIETLGVAASCMVGFMGAMKAVKDEQESHVEIKNNELTIMKNYEENKVKINDVVTKRVSYLSKLEDNFLSLIDYIQAKQSADIGR